MGDNRRRAGAPLPVHFGAGRYGSNFRAGDPGTGDLKDHGRFAPVENGLGARNGPELLSVQTCRNQKNLYAALSMNARPIGSVKRGS